MTPNTYANTYALQKAYMVGQQFPYRRFFQGNPNGHYLANFGGKSSGRLTATARYLCRNCRQSRIETLTRTLTQGSGFRSPNGAYKRADFGGQNPSRVALYRGIRLAGGGAS